VYTLAVPKMDLVVFGLARLSQTTATLYQTGGVDLPKERENSTPSTEPVALFPH